MSREPGVEASTGAALPGASMKSGHHQELSVDPINHLSCLLQDSVCMGTYDFSSFSQSLSSNAKLSCHFLCLTSKQITCSQAPHAGTSGATCLGYSTLPCLHSKLSLSHQICLVVTLSEPFLRLREVTSALLQNSPAHTQSEAVKWYEYYNMKTAHPFAKDQPLIITVMMA